MPVFLRPIAVVLLLLAALAVGHATGAEARTDMEIDRSFGGGGILAVGGFPSTVYPDGRVLTAAVEQEAMVLTRYRSNGRRDRRFGSRGNGTAVVPPIATEFQGTLVWWPSALAVQPSSHILLAGTYVAADLEEPLTPAYRPLEFLPSNPSIPVLARLSPRGALEWIRVGRELPRVVTRRARIRAIAMQGSRILLAGTALNGAFVARLNPNGAVDAEFGVEGGLMLGERSEDSSETASGIVDLLVGHDNRIDAVGYDGQRSMIARFTPDGRRDREFGRRGILLPKLDPNRCPCLSTAYGLARDRQGRLLVSGNVYAGRSAAFLQRYRPDGGLDRSFGRDGTVLARVNGETVGGGLTLGRDGRIFLAGSASSASSRRSGVAMTVFRFLPDGRPDRRFFSDGVFNRYVGNRVGNLVSAPQLPVLDHTGRLSVVTDPLVFRLRPSRAR